MAYKKQTTQGTQGTQGTQRTQRPRECKVCIDAGKPRDEYTSHWVKDQSGNVTCPTLLGQKCLMCGKCGHTTSYCKVVIASPTPAPAKIPPNATAKATTKATPVARPMSSNKYALLAIIDTAQEQNDAFPPLEEKPEITRPTTIHAHAISTAAAGGGSLISWASRINSNQLRPQPPPPHPSQSRHQEQHLRQLPRKPTRPMAIAVSWADQ